MKLCFFLLVLISLFSCSKGYGEKVEDKKVVVYFLDKSYKEMAQKTLDFWIKEGLNGDKIQHLRILKFDKKTIDLQLIASKKKDPKSMTFEEIKLFLELKTKLDSTVFKPKTCRIVICDGSFNPLFIPTN
jgi:hypothetical protein